MFTTLRRALTLAGPLTLAGCAVHGVDHSPAPAPNVSVVTTERTFSLVAPSEATSDGARSTLASTADAFTWLLGEAPARISVVVRDTAPLPPDAFRMPSSGLTTIMVRSGNAFDATLRFHAARAWVSDYASAWTLASGRPASAASPMPDWLYAGMLQVLTAHEVGRDAGALAEPMAVRALLELRLSPEQGATLQRRLRGDADSPSMVSAFAQQAASVLLYLRSTQGKDAVAVLVGATINGLRTEEVLAHLPKPVTPEQLDRDWRAWATDTGTLAAAAETARTH